MAFIRFTAQQLRALLATLAAALGEDSGSGSGPTDYQHTSSDDEVPGLTDTDTRSDSSLGGNHPGGPGPSSEEELDRELSAAFGPQFNRIEAEIAANDGYLPSSVAGIMAMTGHGSPWSRSPSPTPSGGSDGHSRNSPGGRPASETFQDWPSDATIWALSDPDDVSVSEWHSDSSNSNSSDRDESEADAQGEEGEDEGGPARGCKRPHEGNSESEEPPRKRRMR